MNNNEKRPYRSQGLDFSNLTFNSAAEKRYVRGNIERIAAKIKETRTDLGHSQETLAERLSVSVSTIKFIEQNQRSPSLPMFFKILYDLDRQGEIWL
jgi:DNA-binding XRE family transcriptional regulator